VIAKLLFFSALTVITVLAFLPNYNALPDVVSFSDVLNHFLAFLVLTFLFKFAYPALKNILHVILLTLYAVFIEIVQYFLPTRYADPVDILFDMFGIALAYAIISKKFKR